ncbi:phenylalanine--tRNA ligase beta subunit-related protein [Clostridium sp. HBUAS56017]|uniref:B3/B4 domain-containing protein n=1 Tax=Clostridium sp. HBUAS56017 TaxID=2571128 RepID=UPI0011781E20|nr:phenylalanine--tRNA ligase beta subunit-related protein [Clostridium sp. HBUAS56017]
MIDVIISEEFKKICPEITLGCIQAHVDLKSSSDRLWKEVNDYCEVLKEEINIEDLASLPNIKEGRELYKKLGKSPSKYRLSSEALLRRVLQGKGVYKINNIVDINNLISLKFKLPVGSYNIENLKSPVTLMIGKEGEKYKGIGKEEINIANLPVLTDSIGRFGSPTSDSERAMISDNVSEILMCIFSFSGKNSIEKYLEYSKERLELYAKGKDIKIKIVE